MANYNYSKNVLENILNLIQEGKIQDEILNETQLTRYRLYEYLKLLNDGESEFYNPELYQTIKRKIMANGRERNYFDFSALKLAIVNQKLSLEETAKKINKTPEETIEYIDKYYSLGDKKEIWAIFSARKNNLPLKLSSSSPKIQEEIVLTALTYRLSMENIMFLFKTNHIDVERLFFNNKDTYHEALQFLRYETSVVPKEIEQERLSLAKNYWLTRNKYINQITLAKKEGNSVLAEQALENLRNHRKGIDDSIVKSTIGKSVHYLSALEKEKIASYRVKYNISINIASKILKREQNTLYTIEEQVALENKSLAFSLDALINQKKFWNNQYIHNNPKTNTYLDENILKGKK